MNSINESIITKNKKKRIMIVSSEEVARTMILMKFSDNYTTYKKNFTEKTEINFNHTIDNKKISIKVLESSGYIMNTHHIEVSEVSKANGIIFIFNKYSAESLKYIKDFIQNYHLVIGNKFFPCVFVMNESIYNNTNYSTNVTRKEINQVTINGCFPFIKVKNNFDKKECGKILNEILSEIKKEKKDDFPYSLEYREQLDINYCIKNHKVFNIINILTFVFIMLFTFLDTMFIINTQDFLNENKKVDDIFLGIRLNINAINFISAVVFAKYAFYDREKFTKIRRLEKYVMIVNLISWVIQLVLHIRIQHLLKHNENYYSIKLNQIIVFGMMIISHQIMKYLTISNPQKQSKKEDSFIISFK